MKTKDKGDIGITMIIADLTKQGFACFLPISDHLPFDLIAVDKQTFKTFKVQVKFRCIERTDSSPTIILPLTTVYSTKKGNKVSTYDLTTFDYFAVFNPDTSTCFYISTNEIIDLNVKSGVCFSTEKRTSKARVISDYLKFGG